MDTTKALKGISQRLAREGRPGGPVHRLAGRRLALLGARAHYLNDLRHRAPARAAAAVDVLERLAAATASGALIVALDTGMEDGRRLDEVGVCTMLSGEVTTVTYAADDAAYRNPDDAKRVMNHPSQVHVRALFGRTELVPRSTLRSVAAQAVRGAEVVVFHQASSDMENLGLYIEPARILDTARLGRLLTGRNIGLVDLCASLGFEATGNHNSGNDARYALDAALAMLDLRLGALKDAAAAEALKRRALHHAILWPSRKPGSAAVLKAFVDACEACPVPETIPGTRSWLRSWDAKVPRLLAGMDEILQAAGRAR